MSEAPKECAVCSAPIKGRCKTHRFCSARCQNRSLTRAHAGFPPPTVCPGCQSTFQPLRSNRIFCTKKCTKKHWITEHKESDRARKQEYAEKNAEARSAYAREWREANREKVLSEGRKYRSDPQNKAIALERSRAWRKANPERLALSMERRYRGERHAAGHHTIDEWRAICKKQGGKCAHCGVKGRLARDHIVPLRPRSPDIAAGTNFAYNIQALCKSCNSRKHNKLLDYAHPSLFDSRAS
jgi:5-methylcytosine-specific restriction endonuclease McrA